MKIIQPACYSAAAMRLYKNDSPTYFDVSLLCQPTTHDFLNEHTAATQPIGPQLLQVRHLTSSKEDLCLSKLVQIAILHPVRIRMYYRCVISQSKKMQWQLYAKADLRWSILDDTTTATNHDGQNNYIHVIIYVNRGHTEDYDGHISAGWIKDIRLNLRHEK